MTADIAVCQFEPTVGAVDENCATIRALVTDLPDAVELAVFPELCVTGYDLEVAVAEATPVPGPLTDRLVDVARDTGVSLVVGLPERVPASDSSPPLYNDLVLVSPDGVECVYRKQRLWGDEAGVFATGDGPVTVEASVGTVGFLLCYDLNFPELALAYARREVDVLVVSAAWRNSFRADWTLLSRARALDGTCYVAGANHAGDQRGRQHRGGSLLVGPDGTVVDSLGDGTAHAVVSVVPDDLQAARTRNPVRETRAGPD
jgi:predicted amidohydrolase